MKNNTFKKHLSLRSLFCCLLFFPSVAKATPLAIAVKDNNLVQASALLEQGALVNERNALGYTPLMLAAALGNYQMVELLLSAGADVHILDTRMGATPLHKAVQSGVVPVADLLIKHGAFIDVRSPTNGNTPLLDAVWHRNPQMVEYLLDQGANWEIVARGTITPLSLAEINNDRKIVEIIQAHIEKANTYKENTKVFKAIEDNDGQLISELIKGGLNVNEKAKYTMGAALKGVTPLLYASRLGRKEIVEQLIKAGANPRIVDWTMKSTVLHKAGYTGQPQIIPQLIEAGAEIDAQGAYNGYTALHDATWHGHSEAAKMLIENGAKTNLKGLDGNTPLDLAKKYGYTDIQKLLESVNEK